MIPCVGRGRRTGTVRESPSLTRVRSRTLVPSSGGRLYRTRWGGSNTPTPNHSRNAHPPEPGDGDRLPGPRYGRRPAPGGPANGLCVPPVLSPGRGVRWLEQLCSRGAVIRRAETDELARSLHEVPGGTDFGVHRGGRVRRVRRHRRGRQRVPGEVEPVREASRVLFEAVTDASARGGSVDEVSGGRGELLARGRTEPPRTCNICEDPLAWSVPSNDGTDPGRSFPDARQQLYVEGAPGCPWTERSSSPTASTESNG